MGLCCTNQHFIDAALLSCAVLCFAVQTSCCSWQSSAWSASHTLVPHQSCSRVLRRSCRPWGCLSVKKRTLSQRWIAGCASACWRQHLRACVFCAGCQPLPPPASNSIVAARRCCNKVCVLQSTSKTFHSSAAVQNCAPRICQSPAMHARIRNLTSTPPACGLVGRQYMLL